jgi:hypothetical protein
VYRSRSFIRRPPPALQARRRHCPQSPPSALPEVSLQLPPPSTFFSRHGLRSWSRSRIRTVSLPTSGTSRRLNASWATSRTVHRARPSGGLLQHHGDDPLLLAVFQNRRSAGPLLVVERGFEATRLVTMADLPDRLWRQWDHARNPRCASAPGQLQKRQGSQDDTDLLNAAAQQPRQFVLVFRFDFDTHGWASHTPACAKTFLIGIVV